MAANDGKLPGFNMHKTLYGLLGLLRPEPSWPNTLKFAALQDSVTIDFNDNAVPTIQASSLLDAVRAEGYLHGRLRGFQMDFLRRMPAGELAELLGRDALSHDTFMRRLNLKHWAYESMATWSKPAKDMVNAYVQGVNQAWQDGPVAPEYRFLKVRPRPWSAEDTSILTYFLAWSLNSIWTYKWAYGQLFEMEAVHPWLFDALDGTPDTTIIPNTGSPLPWGNTGIGSNNWVVSGDRSQTGHPLLANDPHLMPQLPSIWYQIHVRGGPLDVQGASLPGAPGVIIGQNAHIAWGVTNVDPDCQDLYRIEMEDPSHYRLDGELTALTYREEKVHVRQSADVVLHCEDSHVGPVIRQKWDGSRIALAWTGFGPNTTVDALLQLNLARNWTEFQEALALWTVPAQNFVYADREGHIGYQLGGLIPIHPNGPVLGWADGNTRASQWSGTISWDDMPRLFDPPQGYIVTANNAPVGRDGNPLFISKDSLGYRAKRIDDLIRKTEKHNQESFASIQLDTFSEPLLSLSKKLLADPQLPPGWRRILENFDGTVLPDSSAPTLLYLFAMEAVPSEVQEILNRAFFFDMRVEAPGTHPYPENFWGLMGERLVPAVLTHFDQVDPTSAYARAQEKGQSAFGSDLQRWTWGRAHQINLFHPFNQVNATKAVFARASIPAPGDFFTPCQGAFPVDPSLPWPRNVLYIPSYRQILDPSQPAASLFMHLTGQSGHPLSPHYDDLIALYTTGTLLPGGETAHSTTMTP